MKKSIVFATIIIIWLLMAVWTETDGRVSAENWQVIGPGGGGQITAITEDPSNPDNLYLTINVGGVRKSSDGGQSWQIINRGFDYENLGAGAQRIMDVAVHPDDSQVLLAAGLNGYIYESTNGGLDWRQSYKHPSVDIEEVPYHFSKFVFDPADPSRVYIGVGSIQKLFLGVGARRTENFWPKLVVGPTILMGAWNGSNWDWQAIGSIEGEGRGCDEFGCGTYLNIYSIGIDPKNPVKLFFVTESGVYKGKLGDAGTIERFNRVKRGLPKSKHIHGGKIVFDRENLKTAYLSILNLDNKEIKVQNEKKAVGGIYKTIDGGKNWFKLTQGLDDNSNYFDIQIDPKNPAILYAAQFFMKVGGEWIGGNIYLSDDFGSTWKDLVQHVKINVDAGWQQSDVAKKKKFGVHFISVSKNDNVRWNRGGILCASEDLSSRYPQWTNILTQKIGEDEWTTTGSEAIALAHSIGVDPTDSNTVYLPYGDHSYFKSTNGGDSLRMIAETTEIKNAGNTYDSGTLVIDPMDTQKIFAATQGPHQQLMDGGVMYSDNGGEDWVTLGWHLKDYSGEDKSNRGAKTDLLIEENGDDTKNLYVANFGNTSSPVDTQGGVYMLENFDGSTDPDSINFWNAHWIKIFPDGIQQYMRGTYKLASRDGFNTLYVGVNKDEEGNDYGLYKLTRTTEGWTSTGPILDSDPDSAFNASEAFNDMETGMQSGNIYIATNTGIFVIDGNDDVAELIVPQFEALRAKGVDPEAGALEIHPNEAIIYVASPKTEILRTGDGGQTWEEISQGIGTLGFTILKLDPSADVIYAEAPGAGIWKRSFEASTGAGR